MIEYHQIGWFCDPILHVEDPCFRVVTFWICAAATKINTWGDVYVPFWIIAKRPLVNQILNLFTVKVKWTDFNEKQTKQQDASLYEKLNKHFFYFNPFNTSLLRISHIKVWSVFTWIFWGEKRKRKKEEMQISLYWEDMQIASQTFEALVDLCTNIRCRPLLTSTSVYLNRV